jgi:hypothetical protein
MTRKATTMALSLTGEARATLAALARSRTAPAHHVKRSVIVLHLVNRHDASEIAASSVSTASGSPDALAA